MNQPGTEAPNVAKTQKTFYLDDDLIRLLNAHAKRTGASFTRQVTAAVIQYLFSDPNGPLPRWMELAVELDDEHTDVRAEGGVASRGPPRVEEDAVPRREGRG